jgi:superfamily II DNA or RNA helicase
MITIEIEDYKQWESGLYLISAGTGQGKSWWVTNELYEYACSQNRKIIVLTNRTVLNKQLKMLLGNKEIIVWNYQLLEQNQIRCNMNQTADGGETNLMDVLERFDYIILDEAHYIFQDASFNRNTETILQMVERFYQSKIIVMLTATPNILKDYYCSRGMLKKYYEFEADYSYLRKVYTYSKKDSVKDIIRNIPRDEKIIFFGSNEGRLKELKHYYQNEGERVAFVCARNRDESGAVSQIIENQRFDYRMLFSTQVLDNGINIKDKQVKHIFIEMYDLTEFIQCLGRKRSIDAEDTVTLYFRDYSHSLQLEYDNLKKLLKIYEEDYVQMPENDFRTMYRRRNVSRLFDNCLIPILPAIEKAKADCGFMESIVNGSSRFYTEVCKLLKKPIYFYEKEKKARSLSVFLNQYVGKQLSRTERDEIIYAIDARRNGRILKKPETLNACLKEANVPYKIIVHSDPSKNTLVYWTIEETTIA